MNQQDMLLKNAQARLRFSLECQALADRIIHQQYQNERLSLQLTALLKKRTISLERLRNLLP